MRSAQTHRHEIWPRGLWVAIDSAKTAQLDVSSLFDGLPFDERSVKQLKRVAWDDYVTVVERIEELAGGPEGLARLTEATFSRVIPEVRALAGAVLSPKTLIRLHWEVIAPLIFPAVAFLYVDEGVDRLHLEAQLPPGFRGSRAVHYGTLGAIRGTPLLLGLAPAVVTGETEADHVSWDVRLPPSRSLLARARGRASQVLPNVRVILGYDASGAPVGMSWGADERAPARLEIAARRWGLTRRQLEVLELVVAGKPNKEIAHVLGTAVNTVELHVTHLLRRSTTQSRAELITQFWSAPDPN